MFWGIWKSVWMHRAAQMLRGDQRWPQLSIYSFMADLETLYKQKVNIRENFKLPELKMNIPTQQIH